MTIRTHLKRSQLLLISGLGIIIWLSLLFFCHLFSLTFAFESSIQQHQLWFPRFYILSFLSSKLLFPSIYCTWLAALLWYKNSKSFVCWLFLLAPVFFLSIAVQFYFGFYGVCYFVFPLVFLYILPLFLKKEKVLNKLNKLAMLWNLTENVGFFFVYIILCISLPRFHPFAKYTMFDKFAPTTYVYQLNDEKGNLIPIEKYSSLTNDELYTIGEAEMRKHPLASLAETTKDSLFGKTLMKHFFDNKYPNVSNLGSITLYRLDFTFINNNLEEHKKKLGVYKEE